MRQARRPFRERALANAAAGFAIFGLSMTGCQSFLPTGGIGNFAFGKDAQIAEMARAESFPTPSDVGLSDANSAE